MRLPKLKYYKVAKESATRHIVPVTALRSFSFKKRSTQIRECTSLILFDEGYLATIKKGDLVRCDKDFKNIKKVLHVKDLDDAFEVEHLEEGLLCCCARDPSTIFMTYTRSIDGQTELVVSEVHFDRSLNVKEFRIVVAIPCASQRHHGGTIEFHRGKLYLSIGDTAEQGDPDMVSQDMKTLWGKILEIDVDRANRKGDIPIVIIAMGLRNPWRFFISPRGVMFLGDAGWDTVEKICAFDLSDTRVKNFGWSLFEGSLKIKPGPSFNTFDPPIFEYPTKYEGKDDYPSSVIGGFLIDESTYVFGDFGGYMRILSFDGKTWSQVGIEKLDESIYSMSLIDGYFVLCKGGVYEFFVDM